MRLPHTFPRSRSGWLWLPVLIVAAWAWSVAVTTWSQAPVLVAARMMGDRDVLHVEDLPAGGLAVLLQREDPRFFGHGGVDRDHGATITMAVAADLWPGSALSPTVELAIRAWVLDRVVDKDTQLVVFLNRVPMGDAIASVKGLDQASLRYFGKSCRELDANEFEVLLTLIGPRGTGALYRGA